jgi:hypothetical protein
MPSWRMLNNMRFTPDLAKAPLATIRVGGSDQKRHGIRKPRRPSGGRSCPSTGRSVAHPSAEALGAKLHSRAFSACSCSSRPWAENQSDIRRCDSGVVRQPVCDASSADATLPRPGCPTRQFWQHASGRPGHERERCVLACDSPGTCLPQTLAAEPQAATPRRYQGPRGGAAARGLSS